jgi:SAM-dependent methyltransferase
MSLAYDNNYTNILHSPGIEPWITGFLKDRVSERALDLGCGLGFTALLLKLYLGNVKYLVGLDISVDKLLKTKKLNLYDDLIVADAKSLPFRDSAFDFLISIEVIHGLPVSVFSFIEHLLKGRSSVVLSIPSLPKGVSIEDLVHRKYCVYRYMLRGFVLVDLKRYKVLLAVNSRFFRVLNAILTILMPLLKVTKTLERGYLLVFR